MTMMTIKSEHFSLEELCKSKEAEKRGINNIPTVGVAANLCNLITEVLEPARRSLGVPIIVTSGYRCPALNKAVGGVSNSQHLTGQAADLVCTRYEDKRRLFEILKEMDVDQLLWERNSKGTTWVHVSFVAHGDNRQMVRDNYNAK